MHHNNNHTVMSSGASGHVGKPVLDHPIGSDVLGWAEPIQGQPKPSSSKGFKWVHVRATLHHIMRFPFQGHYQWWCQPKPTEIPSSASLQGWDMTGPEHTYTQVLWLSSVYNQLAPGTCEGTLPGVGLSSEIKLRICTALGTTKYLSVTSCNTHMTFADKLQLVLSHSPHYCHFCTTSRIPRTSFPHSNSEVINSWPWIPPIV